MTILKSVKSLAVASATGAALLLSGVGISAAATDTSDNEPTNDGQVTCFDDFTWASQSTLHPGANDVVDRQKELTHGADVAVDGWTGSRPGVDGWDESGTPTFRIVVGTLSYLTDVNATIAYVGNDDAEFTGTNTLVSPAAGATPPEYKKKKLTNLVEPQLADDKKSFSCNITEDQILPKNSSASFNATGNKELLGDSTKPLTVKVTVTDKIAVPCEEDPDNPGYYDHEEGSAGSVCEVDWTLASTMDNRLIDPSNNGYRSKDRDTNNGDHLPFQTYLSRLAP
ncbi:hypothetical protein [Brevibacterium luteolum]|uniref:hypothetical protein n=1 Tax=Brevibacterium luteolum TaxID=199591 RepID=UPI00223B7019|nr:hypothetical protein [Brevibacterium luteolum]MCT1830316.1 hypothetical protein [Brevibacterium luteolum]